MGSQANGRTELLTFAEMSSEREMYLQTQVEQILIPGTESNVSAGYFPPI